jgi:hypothetical protein
MSFSSWPWPHFGGAVKARGCGAQGSAESGDSVRHGSNSPPDQYSCEGRMSQPPKTALVRSVCGQSGKRGALAVGNWRWQMSCWCCRELYLETSWLGPRLADWKKPGWGVSVCALRVWFVPLRALCGRRGRSCGRREQTYPTACSTAMSSSRCSGP